MEDQDFIESRLLIITKRTFDVLSKYDNAIDLIALYLFYYYTAKWQGTSQIKATTGYAMKGLNITERRIQAAKKVLIDLKLIEDIKRKDVITGLVVGWYIKVKYLWDDEKIHSGENAEVDTKTTPANIQPLEKCRENALLDINLNALEDIIKPEFLLIANLLRDEILKNDPGAKISDQQVKKWTKDVRLMVERDKRTLAQIRDVLLWSQSHSFWRQNILSMGTLRDKFTRLVVQMKPADKAGSVLKRERSLNYDVRKKPANI